MNNKDDNINELYPIVFIFREKRYFTLWYTSDVDGFILNEKKNKIKTFDNKAELDVYISENGYNLNNVMTEIQCDNQNILNKSDINCNSILTFWNIVSDIANSLNVYFIGNCNYEKITSIYNKLFYGCNLPAIRKGGDEYIPDWTQKEIETLGVVIENCLNILLKYLI